MVKIPKIESDLLQRNHQFALDFTLKNYEEEIGSNEEIMEISHHNNKKTKNNSKNNAPIY